MRSKWERFDTYILIGACCAILGFFIAIGTQDGQVIGILMLILGLALLFGRIIFLQKQKEKNKERAEIRTQVAEKYLSKIREMALAWDKFNYYAGSEYLIKRKIFELQNKNDDFLYTVNRNIILAYGIYYVLSAPSIFYDFVKKAVSQQDETGIVAMIFQYLNGEIKDDTIDDAFCNNPDIFIEGIVAMYVTYCKK